MTFGGDHSGRRRRFERPDEAGFMLIETIVSALLLVVVALAILSSLDAATKTAGANKGRTVASALAEQDQERMRGLSITQLSNLRGQQTVTVGGAAYTVTSRADWVRDSANTTESCTDTGTQADYVRITSTVTSGIVGKDTRPVTTQGLVSVPVGSFGPNQGTLTIKVLNRDGNPVKDMGVTASGPTALSDTTNDLGCAVFGFIPTGSYTAQLNKTNWVDIARNQISTQGVTVAAGSVVTKTMQYDQAAQINATFIDSNDAAVNTAGDTKLRMTNPAVPTGFPDTDVAAGQPGAAVTSLFPFNSAYVVYAGSCDNANPALYSHPVASKLLDPAENWTPQVRLPTIQVTVTKGTVPVAVANTTVKIKATGTAAGCTGDQVVLNSITTNASGVASVPMPYGTYDVCVNSSGETGEVLGVANTAPAGAPAPVTIAASGPAC
jgi:type II secretory pathway pseudopilin PulG